MKILVTGSSGWLGRHLVPMLKEAGYQPFGLDVAGSEWTDMVASVADRELVTELIAQNKFDGVIHAGALHKPDIARYPQQAFIDVNITGTLNLLEAAVENNISCFVFTSTTSLMISQRIRKESSDEAVWLDEEFSPVEPRNIYGVTKLAAEGLCRQHHLEHGINAIVLRTARFFPEEDDTLRDLSGPNLKANEFLNRRASVRDMARAHIAALERVADLGFGLYIVSAPTPFSRADVRQIKHDVSSVICEAFPDAQDLYGKMGWQLPESIGRVYDGSLIMHDLDFQYETTFGTILSSMRAGKPAPIDHDATYNSPLWQST